MKTLATKKTTSLTMRCLKAALPLAALLSSAYTFAGSCPDAQSIKGEKSNGTYVYTSGDWRGTNEDSGIFDDTSYANETLKFNRVTISQRKVGTQGEAAEDKAGDIISFVKCDYIGTGKNARVRLSKRFSTLPTADAGTWEPETIEKNGKKEVVLNSAGTENKYCTSQDCTFK
ncbi:hypothetical protein ASE80_19470 [Pseudomonas sp. Leaf15]|uniref:hypothetical protein n=1 Tax=unclassified Pseudomonas TaxID=196821 RepID=UPI000703A97F|nr:MULTISPECIES: hypothetical protein [unclassified Pseudomonas]KQM55030.1 hypothetical protein ASE80_19470 [Pseudomonas sp. Leaf15]RAH00767.1 hypothetical protein DJ480_20680 [Pseudomonas sp. Leaf98]